MRRSSNSAAKRNRRSPEELIQDLEKRIHSIRQRAAQRKIRQSPALRHTRAALKAIEKAIGASNDTVLSKSLSEARDTISACLALGGVE